MREWFRLVAGGLLGRPLYAHAQRDTGSFPGRPWARWALAGAGMIVVLVVALSAFHAYGAPPAINGATGNVVGARGEQGVAASAYSPLVSRGKPVWCSTNSSNEGEPNAVTSGKYGEWSFWQASVNAMPAWCAIHIGVGPKRLLVAWCSNYIFDYISSNGMTPRDYTLSVSGDSSNGADGHWQTMVSVTNNETRVREVVIPFAGMSWIKMTVTRGQAQPTQPFVRIDQIDCYDVSASLNDTVLFQGDSLTVLSYNRFEGSHPSFDELMHQMDRRLYPAMLNVGMGGWDSGGAVHHVQEWLALSPDIHYWLLGWGTNDALNMLNPTVFHDNMQYLVDAIKAAGHVPVLAHIPAVNRAGAQGRALDAEIRALNAQIDLLTRTNHLIPGPDLYTLVSQHLDTYVGPDGIHPTSAGAVAMNYAWYLAMRDELKASVR